MDERKAKKDTVEKVKRKLAKVRARLDAAEEEHAQSRVKGQQEIDQARLRAAKRQSKAAKKVAKWSQEVSRIEARLERAQEDAAQVSTSVAPQVGTSEPPEGLYSSDTAGSGPLRERADRALAALRSLEGGIATAQEWRAASAMPGTTFLRARRELLDHGLVRAVDADERNGRYALTDSAVDHPHVDTGPTA